MPKFFCYPINPNLALLGFFVALFSTGIGIGGGTILVSVLMSLFGFNFKEASSTSLSTIIPISFIGSLSYFIFLPEILQLKHYVVFVPSCVIGAILGGRIVQKRQNGWLKFVFSVFLFIISLRMLKIYDFPFLIYNGLHVMFFTNEWLLMMPIGILIGIVAVLLGIGCGLLIVPFFVIVVNFNMHEAIALSLTTIFFLSLSATIVHNKLKTLNNAPLNSLFIPALIGAVVGVIISSHLPAPILKQLFGIFLFIMACNYMISGLVLHHRRTASVKNFIKESKRTL